MYFFQYFENVLLKFYSIIQWPELEMRLHPLANFFRQIWHDLGQFGQIW